MSGAQAQWRAMWKCTEAGQSSYNQSRGSRQEVQETVMDKTGCLPRLGLLPPGAGVFLGSLPGKSHWTRAHLSPPL